TAPPPAHLHAHAAARTRWALTPVLTQARDRAHTSARVIQYDLVNIALDMHGSGDSMRSTEVRSNVRSRLTTARNTSVCGIYTSIDFTFIFFFLLFLLTATTLDLFLRRVCFLQKNMHIVIRI